MTALNTISVQIAKLTVRTGDVLVLKSSETISYDLAKRIRETVEPHLPEGVKMMVLDRSQSLEILTRDEIEARTAA
jgi:siroheme synthase (precorrin-2 oxidase/ferrochelatase)